MFIVVAFSILLGLVWNVIAVLLLGGRLGEAFGISWAVAGALAGVFAGLFTVWSRKRREGEESFSYGLATYYLGIFVYWAGFVIVERVSMCLRQGGWTDFGLRDHLILIWLFVLYGTIYYGVVLIPFAFFSRYVVWRIYNRFAA